MKKVSYLFILLMLMCMTISAQTKWINPLKEGRRFIHGRGWPAELKENYNRFPERTKQIIRPEIWNLSQQSAGLSIVFRSNAPEIKVRYGVTGGLAMPHMPATGVSGIDLYATDIHGKHRWCAARYAFGDTICFHYNKLWYEEDYCNTGYEYHIYLPLYNQVKWLEIGVPENAMFRLVPMSQEKPIIVYGTSIAQGACASRPGLAWSNIVEREMEHPLINLGFSGNGRLEASIFDLMAEIDAKLYIIDCLPNMVRENAKYVYERTLAGVTRLRKANAAPILLVEHSGYLNEYTSKVSADTYKEANRELRRAYNALREQGLKNLYYLTKEELGLTIDAMVEGIHPNDLGMRLYADGYIKKIRKIFHQESSLRTSFIACTQNRDEYNWKERHESILQMNQEDAPEILMLGNSITHYWGGEPASNIARGKQNWSTLFKGKKVRNLGFGWDRIENGLWRIYHGELDGYDAQKVFLLLGTNNLGQNTNEEIVNGIMELASAAQQYQPKAIIYVCGIMPRAKMEKRIAILNAALKNRVLEAGLKFVDLTSRMVKEDGTLRSDLFIDGLHPNEEGYKEEARMLKTAINE